MMRNLRHYSGATMFLIWLVMVALGFTFWAGVSCLIGHIFRGITS